MVHPEEDSGVVSSIYINTWREEVEEGETSTFTSTKQCLLVGQEAVCTKIKSPCQSTFSVASHIHIFEPCSYKLLLISPNSCIGGHSQQSWAICVAHPLVVMSVTSFSMISSIGWRIIEWPGFEGTLKIIWFHPSPWAEILSSRTGCLKPCYFVYEASTSFLHFSDAFPFLFEIRKLGLPMYFKAETIRGLNSNTTCLFLVSSLVIPLYQMCFLVLFWMFKLMVSRTYQSCVISFMSNCSNLLSDS